MRILFFALLLFAQALTDAKSLEKAYLQALNSSKTQFRILLSKDDTNKSFDPFIDYGEFQDNVTEEESLSFFQHGRSLSMILLAGYEGVTFNMRQVYGDSLFFVGFNISFFIDFHIAFQLSGVFPTGHYNSLFNQTWSFFHYGLDMKYYWHKQYINEEQKFFNPYLVVGPFIFNVAPIASSESTSNQIPTVPTTNNVGAVATTRNISTSDEKALFENTSHDLGLKTGLGVELNILESIFISFEITHLYTKFKRFENIDLSDAEFPPLPESPENQNILYWLQYPIRPEVKGYKFYGDLFQITTQIGFNF